MTLQFNPQLKVERLYVVDYPKSCELLVVRQKDCNHIWILVYRPPDCSVGDTLLLCDAISDLVVKFGKCDVSVLGDFNASTIDWSADLPTSNNCSDKIISEMCIFCGLTQLVKLPTRGQNYLDLVLTTNPNAFLTVITKPPIGNSDHDVVKCVLCEQSKSLQDQITYNFSCVDYAKFSYALSCIDWSAFFAGCNTIDQYWLKFRDLMTDLIDKFVPKRYNVRNAKNQMKYKGISKEQKVKKRAWLKWRADPTSANKRSFNIASKKLKLYSKKSVARKEFRFIHERSNDIYKYMSSKLHHSSRLTELRTEDGMVTSDAANMCELLSKQFASNFSQPDGCVYKSMNEKNEELHIMIDEPIVLKTLCNLKNSAPGPDGIPAILLRTLAHCLVRPITIIFQQSMFTGKIPTDWKIAKIIPLFKGKGDKQDANSYRPISLTSVVCKALERIICDQINVYLKDNALLTDSQHGFRKGRSTTTNLLSCDAEIARSLNDGKDIELFLLDFQRAFDKVDHGILLDKLNNFGIRGMLNSWFADFLSNRQQFVQIGYTRSALYPVVSGVVQGSVCGPQLFSLFVNDLVKVLKVLRMFLFADDSKSIGEVSSEKDCKLIQADLDSIAKWSDANKLPLSVMKSFHLHYGRSWTTCRYNLGNSVIAKVESQIDLGIMRSTNLSYSQHIEELYSKLNKLTGMTLRVFESRSSAFMSMLWTVYLRPKLEYAVQVWNGSYNSRCLDNIQRKFTKKINGLYNLSYEERLLQLRMPTLLARRSYLDLKFMHKLLHKQYDIQPRDLGVEYLSSRTRGDSLNLVVRRPKNTAIAKTYPFRIQKQWNQLPVLIKACNSHQKFKSKLQTFCFR